MWKNFKQQCLRRPLALACKLLCPALCTIGLGAIRFAFTESDPFVDYYEIEYGPIVPNSDVASWIYDAVCSAEYYYDETEEDWLEAEAVRYLAIIPPPDTNTHVRGLLDLMNASWPYDYTDDELECAFGTPSAGVDCTNVNETDSLVDEDCGGYARYLPFREGWLLRYFDNDDEFNSFITSNDYGRKYYNPLPTVEYNEDKPIGTAISFEVNADGTQWSYKIRGNTSQDSGLWVPGTAGDTIDIFSREGFDDRDLPYFGEGGDQFRFLDLQAFIEKSIATYIGQMHNVSMGDDIFTPVGMLI